jgi:hypothetical protein
MLRSEVAVLAIAEAPMTEQMIDSLGIGMGGVGHGKQGVGCFECGGHDPRHLVS